MHVWDENVRLSPSVESSRLIHEQQLRKAWTDDDLQVYTEDNERFEELLDDGGRVDTISGEDRNFSEMMHS